MAAPYLAVAVGLLWLGNGWIAILGYHAQILMWLGWDRWRSRGVRAADPERRAARAHGAHLRPAALPAGHAALRDSIEALFRPGLRVGAVLLTFALAGPAAYLLLPVVTSQDVGQWLGAMGISGVGFALMVPYFGIVHPILEQQHWAPLRERTFLSHGAFAGYHAMVLGSLLTEYPHAAVITALGLASITWAWMVRRTGGITAATVSHMLADFGVVLAAAYLIPT